MNFLCLWNYLNLAVSLFDHHIVLNIPLALSKKNVIPKKKSHVDKQRWEMTIATPIFIGDIWR